MPLDYRKDGRYAHLTAEQVRRHYEEEKALRNHLLATSKEKRATAFLWAYDELFRRCPWHPALTERSGANAPEVIERRVQSFLPFLPPSKGSRILEIGCGNGELIIGLARKGFACAGVDVSDVRLQRLRDLKLSGLEFFQAEGTTLPLPDGSFDSAISMQLFEHLHPDDAVEHLREVHRVLKPGGKYFLETPNRLVGPADVSRFFVDVAEGFHLREYSVRDMVDLFRQAGFSSARVILGWSASLSSPAALRKERMWSLLPKRARRRWTLGLGNPLYVGEKSPL
jgi:SAM-dependent methyltransferase